MENKSIQNNTCIVGIAEKGNVYIGADSAGVNASSLSIHQRKDVKAFKNCDFIIGCTMSFRMIQLLQYKLHPPKQKQDQSDMQYLVCDFIDEVRKVFKENNFDSGSFLVGYNGNIYNVYDDFQIAHCADNYTACGCGTDLALGSLYSTKNSKMKPKERLQLALEAAAHHSAGVIAPFHYVEIIKANKK